MLLQRFIKACTFGPIGNRCSPREVKKNVPVTPTKEQMIQDSKIIK